MPKYLVGSRNMKDRNLIAKYRCGNGMRRNQFWVEEEERQCRICGEGEENIRHILEECAATKQEV